MKLNQLPKISQTKAKRLGRGYGSGKGGHTSSRGQKGQRSRGSIAVWFEGGQLPFIRRLPFIKGKNRFKSLVTVVTLNLSQLETMKAGSIIDSESLAKAGLIAKTQVKSAIKILGRGTLTKALTVNLPTSAQAKAKIEKVGGTVSTTTAPKTPPSTTK